MTPQQTQFAAFDPSKAKLENPEEIRPVYSNNTTCMTSPHDFRIVFTEVVANEIGKPPVMELRASVALSPVQAKALSMGLSEAIKLFEAQNGPINWPPQQPKTH